MAVKAQFWPGEIGDGPPGAFKFAIRYNDPEDAAPCNLLFKCPCGCGKLGALFLRGPHARQPVETDGRDSWDWDGNREAPTLSPSILSWELDERGKRVDEHWHGYLTAGIFKGCNE